MQILCSLQYVVDFGSNRDGAVFKNCIFGNLVGKFGVKCQPESCLGMIATIPHVFVANDASALQKEIMKPYHQRVLDNPKRILTYHLSRPQKCLMWYLEFYAPCLEYFISQLPTMLTKLTILSKPHVFFTSKDSIMEYLQLLRAHYSFQWHCQMLVWTTNWWGYSFKGQIMQIFLKPNVALPW